MNCIITAGPTYEPLDEVRRLTNFSSGRLGSDLANFLVTNGHRVTLLLGHYATWRGEQHAQTVRDFTTTVSLRDALHELSKDSVDAVFHAAAVSDFGFGRIWEKTETGELIEAHGGKVSTRSGTLMAELVPTPKIISSLREWFPQACLIGWKYEVDGDRTSVVAKAKKQIVEGRTTACVANGPAYGFGFGLVQATGHPAHFSDTGELYGALERLAGAS